MALTRQQLVAHYHQFCHAHGLHPSDVIVGAGGTCVMIGVRQQTADIDVTVPPAVMYRFLKAGADYAWFGSTLVVTGDELIDLHFPDREIDAVEIDGVWCESPRSTLAFKRWLNRPKDQADIEGLERYIGIR